MGYDTCRKEEKHCSNCSLPLGSYSIAQHRCMEGNTELIYGRAPCPLCGKGCYPFKDEDKPGSTGQKSGKCCFCGMYP